MALQSGEDDAFGHVRLGGIGNAAGRGDREANGLRDPGDDPRPHPAGRHADRVRPRAGHPVRRGRHRRRARRRLRRRWWRSRPGTSCGCRWPWPSASSRRSTTASSRSPRCSSAEMTAVHEVADGGRSGAGAAAGLRGRWRRGGCGRATGWPSCCRRRPACWWRCWARSAAAWLPVPLNPALLDEERAAPARRRAARAGRRRRRRPGRAARRARGRAGAGAAGPAHALHVGHDRAAEGRVVGRARRAPTRPRCAPRRREVWGFDADDVHLVCSPLHHSAPIRFACRHAAGRWHGGRAVDASTRRPSPRDRRASADDGVHGARRTCSVCSRSATCPTCRRSGWSPTPARRVPSRSSAAAIDAFPAGSVWEFYGSTEGQFTVCATDEWLDHPGTVGRARPGRAPVGRRRRHHLVRGAGSSPASSTGATRRGPRRRGAATRSRCGDLGRLDDDGYLYLDGRRDDLIITGGVNVYPAEVEQVLAGLPGVHRRGRVRCGRRAVGPAGVRRRGRRRSTADDVIAHARRHLAPYKCPKQVFVVGELPHTSTGQGAPVGAVASELGLDG